MTCGEPARKHTCTHTHTHRCRLLAATHIDTPTPTHTLTCAAYRLPHIHTYAHTHTYTNLRSLALLCWPIIASVSTPAAWNTADTGLTPPCCCAHVPSASAAADTSAAEALTMVWFCTRPAHGPAELALPERDSRQMWRAVPMLDSQPAPHHAKVTNKEGMYRGQEPRSARVGQQENVAGGAHAGHPSCIALH